jgi:hypothetical protein
MAFDGPANNVSCEVAKFGRMPCAKRADARIFDAPMHDESTNLSER